MTLPQLCTATAAQPPAVTAALRRLAFAGQVIHDLPNRVYRFRQVMPMVLGDAQLGPENAELSAVRRAFVTQQGEARIVHAIGADHGSHRQSRRHASRNRYRPRRTNPPRQVHVWPLPQIRHPQRPLPPHDRAAFAVDDSSTNSHDTNKWFCLAKLILNT